MLKPISAIPQKNFELKMADHNIIRWQPTCMKLKNLLFLSSGPQIQLQIDYFIYEIIFFNYCHWKS